MGWIIGFGGWLCPYYYIIASITTKIIKDDVLGFGNNSIVYKTLISKHNVMVLCFGYCSEMILGILVHLFVYLREKRRRYRKRQKLALQRKSSLEDQNNYPLFKDEIKTNQGTIDINNEIKNSETIDSSPSIDSAYNLHQSKTLNGRTIKQIELIHNDLYKEITENSLKYILLSSVLIVSKEILIKMIFSINDIFDYFFFDLLIMTIISKIQYKERIYSHQLIALIVVFFISGGCLISCLFESTSIFGSYTDSDTSQRNSVTITILEMFKDNYHMIVIMILIYLAISVCSCYGITLQKIVMETKFVTPYKIAFYKGVVGFIISLIILIISTNIKCDEKLVTIVNNNDSNNTNSTNNTINNNTNNTLMNYYVFNAEINETNGTNETINTKLFEFIVCSINYSDSIYYDHFIEYFDSLNRENPSKKHLELIFGFLYFNLHFIASYSLIIVNKYLSPIHCLIVESLYSTVHITFQFIFESFGDNDFYTILTEDFYCSLIKTKGTRILKIIAYLVGVFGYFIYLEIIELRFCGLNTNIRRNIRKRAISDARMRMRDDSSNGSDSDSEDSNESSEKELKILRNEKNINS